MHCDNHHDQEPAFHCLGCKRYFCKGCVSARHFETFTAYICKVCGGKCDELTPQEIKRLAEPAARRAPAQSEHFNFWLHLLTMFIYPFEGAGKLITPVATLTFCLVSVIPVMAAKVPLALLLGLYAVICLMTFLEISALSQNSDSARWPQVTEWQDCVVKVWGFLMATILCYGPAFYYFLKIPKPNALFWVLCALGFYFYPMCIAAVGVTQKIEMLNPFFVIRSIFRTFFPYTVACALWITGIFILWWIGTTPLMSIPFLGRLLRWSVVAYLLCVMMRLLGVFYRAYKQKLDWFEGCIPQEIEKKSGA